MINKKDTAKVRDYFLTHGATIAIAESVTAGLLQLLFAAVPDAAKFFQGGITAYNLGQKYRHLQVEPTHALECNCVSLKVAEQMALNVCGLFCSDWGIGVTGYASPVPESGNKLFCYYAISHRGVVVSSGKIDSSRMLPAKVQQGYTREITDRFIDAIDAKTA